MKPEEFPGPASLPEPADGPELSRPSLDPSEEEALFQHLRRYQARNGRRRHGRKLIAAGTVVAGAGFLLVAASIARWTPSRSTAPTPEIARPVVVLPAVNVEPQASRADTPPGPRASQRDAPGTPQASQRDAPATSQASQPDVPATSQASQPDVPATPQASQPDVPAPPRGGRPEAPAARDDKTPAISETIASLPPVPAPRAPTQSAPIVSYQPRERLATVSPGDTKERVFDRFATTFEQRNGSVVRVEGMRWRANGRSPRHAQVEVAEVVLADAGAERLYWFVFGDGRLIGWGRHEEWPAAVRRHEIEIDYQPAASRPGRR